MAKKEQEVQKQLYAALAMKKEQEVALAVEKEQEAQMQLSTALAVKKEQDVALAQLRKFVWDYCRSVFMTMLLAELPVTLKRFLNM